MEWNSHTLVWAPLRLYMINPLGSLVRILKDILPDLAALQGGSTWNTGDVRLLIFSHFLAVTSKRRKIIIIIIIIIIKKKIRRRRKESKRKRNPSMSWRRMENGQGWRSTTVFGIQNFLLSTLDESIHHARRLK